MAVNSIIPPYPTFSDLGGVPLEAGYIFIGEPGFEARATPKASYFDFALTVATGTASGAAVRTISGYPVKNGSPTMVYVDGDFSITVTDKNGAVVYTSLSRTFAYGIETTSNQPVLAPDGNFANAGYAWINEVNTGLVRNTVGSVQEIVQGVLVSSRTSAGTVFNQPVSGTGFADGVTASLGPDITAIEALSGTGFAVRTAANTWAQRQITSLGGTVAITNPAGVAGDINIEANKTVVGLLTTTGAATVGPFALPAGVKRFRVTSQKSSLSGTGNILIQLRVAGAFVTTGYDASSVRGSATNVTSTSGFIVSLGNATDFWQGAMEFTLHDPATNLWLATHIGREDTAGANAVTGAGSIALSGAVDGLQINSTAGTFDVSSFNVSY